jgi:hypothetical protein
VKDGIVTLTGFVRRYNDIFEAGGPSTLRASSARSTISSCACPAKAKNRIRISRMTPSRCSRFEAAERRISCKFRWSNFCRQKRSTHAWKVAAVKRRLVRDGGLVMRYDTENGVDGLSEGEGAFLACSFWLTDNYVLQGRIAEARILFERLLTLHNDLGLLTEEYDPHAGQVSPSLQPCRPDQYRTQPDPRRGAGPTARLPVSHGRTPSARKPQFQQALLISYPTHPVVDRRAAAAS